MTNEVTLQIIKHLSTIFICRNKVYSNQIFKHILIPMFSGFNTIYSLAYGDFNGLNKFNRLYGNDAGTQAMIDSIRIMQEHLPDDTISVRISGDEFIFLIPSMTSTQVHEELSLAQNILKQSPEQFLTMSFGVVDSNEKSDIYKMYSLAESRENIAKLNSKTENYSSKVIQRKLDEAFSKFFDNYRFSNKIELKSEHIDKLGKLAIHSALDLISLQEFSNFYLPNKEAIKFSSLFTPTTPIFTTDQAKMLFEYINTDNYPNDKFSTLIYSVYPIQVSKLFREIIVNPNSNFFNNIYYEAFFEHKLPKNTYRPATTIMLDVTGIKDCNAKKSHLETDLRLAELSSKISEALKEILDIKFDHALSLFNARHNYIFNRFGGNFLILIGNKEITDSQMSDFISSLNCVDISPMHLLSTYSTNRDITYNETIAYLEADILNKKSIQLENHIDSSETKESFDLFISDAVDFFMKKSPNSYEFETQRNFLQELANSLVKQVIKSNKEFLFNSNT